MYVDDPTSLYLIAILKSYGIRHIVASPGTQNAGFNLAVQDDPDFQCFSVVDERSAAYVATGIAFETGRPVVLTCTGATASRNYLSALTEAYYRKLPIIALTYTHYADKYDLSPQFLDRSVSQNDVKVMSVELPVIESSADRRKCISHINAAIATALITDMPVHVNVVNPPRLMSFHTKELPTDFWTTELYKHDPERAKAELSGKKVAVFIGAHKKFTAEEQDAISAFARSYGAAVFCDHTSNYHGANKALVAQVVQRVAEQYRHDVIIDIGCVSGEYSSSKLFSKAAFWRVAQDGNFRTRYGKELKKLFLCSELEFFTKMKSDSPQESGCYAQIKAQTDALTVPELPLCNALVCRYLAQYMPAQASLHIGILNSLRNMNYFNLPESVDVVCNVGGFGIDGPVSSAIGQSLATQKPVFALIGDLAFFYDMNSLGIREIRKNLRLIIVNNNHGQEFHINPLLEDVHAEKTDHLVAAAGHYKAGAKSWAEACGFRYSEVRSRADLEEKIRDICSETVEGPALLEVFTGNEDEQTGLELMRSCDKQSTGLLKKIFKR